MIEFFALETFSFTRVSAMVLRYYYLLISSWPRIADLVYWPLVQMITWGFLQTYLVHQAQGTNGNGAVAGASTLIAAIMLWDVLFRTQLGFSLSFMEELWSRNLANLMMSPLRPFEFVAALMVMSLVRLAIGILPVSLLAIWFFGFNLYSLGFGLVLFFINLILTSWSIGLVVAGFLLKHGLGAEGLVWTFLFLILPLVCVYYPVAVLPSWLQPLAWALPPTYVFESMRSLLIEHRLPGSLMLESLSLNLIYLCAAGVSFLWLFGQARDQGSLLQTGE